MILILTGVLLSLAPLVPSLPLPYPLLGNKINVLYYLR